MNMDAENAEKLEILRTLVELYNQKIPTMKMDFETISIDEICDNIQLAHSLILKLDNIRRGLLDVRRK